MKDHYVLGWDVGNNMEEKINKFFEKNKIKVDENGNFEMYVVVDVNDKDHETGVVICGKEVEVYTKERAYKNLKESNINEWITQLTDIDNIIFNIKTIKTKERKTIRDKLLTIKNKIFKISINKENIQKAESDKLIINKYKVLEEEILEPVLKYKIIDIKEENIKIKLYNNLTENFKTIDLYYCEYLPNNVELSEMIKNYLDRDEEATILYNTVNENGIELR
jgi:hypothetical protein